MYFTIFYIYTFSRLIRFYQIINQHRYRIKLNLIKINKNHSFNYSPVSFSSSLLKFIVYSKKLNISKWSFLKYRNWKIPYLSIITSLLKIFYNWKYFVSNLFTLFTFCSHSSQSLYRTSTSINYLFTTTHCYNFSSHPINKNKQPQISTEIRKTCSILPIPIIKNSITFLINHTITSPANNEQLSFSLYDIYTINYQIIKLVTITNHQK